MFWVGRNGDQGLQETSVGPWIGEYLFSCVVQGFASSTCLRMPPYDALYECITNRLETRAMRGEFKELKVESLRDLYGQGFYDSTVAVACILIGHESAQGAVFIKCPRWLIGINMLVYEVFGDAVVREEWYERWTLLHVCPPGPIDTLPSLSRPSEISWFNRDFSKPAEGCTASRALRASSRVSHSLSCSTMSSARARSPRLITLASGCFLQVLFPCCCRLVLQHPPREF